MDFGELYRKYDAELRPLCARLRGIYHRMQQQGYRAVFGDVEGEVLYMLLREARPRRVFEISPAAGFSTNYLLAALTANQTGELHSFELLREINGRPTADVIRSNLVPDLDTSRWTLHLGDARETVPAVAGEVDFALLDSSHEEWFARWYVETVFPRVRGWVMVQDIAFHDRIEPSGEARFVWDWAGREQVPLTMVGHVEQSVLHSGVRRGFAERRALECNSLLFQLPQTGRAALPTLNLSPDERIRQAEECVLRQDATGADRHLTEVMDILMTYPWRTNRHRLFFKTGQLYVRLGEPLQAERCFRRAVGAVLGGEPAQRAKGLRELWRLTRRQKLWRLAAEVGVMMVQDWVWNYRSWRIKR